MPVVGTAPALAEGIAGVELAGKAEGVMAAKPDALGALGARRSWERSRNAAVRARARARCCYDDVLPTEGERERRATP